MFERIRTSQKKKKKNSQLLFFIGNPFVFISNKTGNIFSYIFFCFALFRKAFGVDIGYSSMQIGI